MDIAKTHPEGSDATLREAENASVGFARVVEQIAKQVGAHAHAGSVFGEPVTRDGVTVIPVARVIAAFGAGAGGGAADKTQHTEDGRGGGGGGGGGFVVTPVGMIEIREAGARFRRMEPPLGVWRDVAELVLFAARRGWTSVARSLKKD